MVFAIADLYKVSIQNFYSANTIFNDAGDVPAGGSILGVHVALAGGASIRVYIEINRIPPIMAPLLRQRERREK